MWFRFCRRHFCKHDKLWSRVNLSLRSDRKLLCLFDVTKSVKVWLKFFPLWKIDFFNAIFCILASRKKLKNNPGIPSWAIDDCFWKAYHFLQTNKDNLTNHPIVALNPVIFDGFAKVLLCCWNVKSNGNCWNITARLLRILGSARLIRQQQREQAALRSHIPECQSGDVTLPVLTALADCSS